MSLSNEDLRHMTPNELLKRLPIKCTDKALSRYEVFLLVLNMIERVGVFEDRPPHVTLDPKAGLRNLW